MNAIPTLHVLLLGGVLFALGIAGVLVKRNLIVLFLCVELILNAANLTFIAFAREVGSLDGQAAVFLAMVLAAVEAAVGLALVVALHRLKNTVDADRLDTMKH